MNKIAICAILKNEHKYLKEWIEHHLSIGFTHIYLFEDYNSLSHKSITDIYNQVTLLTLEEFDISNNSPWTIDCGRQFALYDKALKYFNGIEDWMAFIDIDEYITLCDNYTLEKLVKEFYNEKGLYLCWKDYGANGNIYETNELLCKRFTKNGIIPEGEKNYAMKSFVNLNYGNHKLLGLHHVEGLCNTKRLHTAQIIKCYDKAFIIHYFTKSWQEWCNRWLRGDYKWGKRTLDYFFEVNPDMLPQKEMLHNLAKQWLGYELYKISLQ